MGGEVGAEVRSGESNSLWFQLRLLKQPEMKRRAAEPDVELGGVRVLVVDPRSPRATRTSRRCSAGAAARRTRSTGGRALAPARRRRHDDPFKLALVDSPSARRGRGEQVGAMIHPTCG